MEEEQPFKLKPRPYQVELFKKAVQNNSIIFLGTGSGKTFIAVMMMKEFLPEVLNSNKKIIFLVNTVVLARQQSSFIEKHLSVAVKSFCGEDGVDSWDKIRWTEEKQSCKIMVMIGVVFRDALLKRYIHEEEVSLIIVDECHHCKKDSPYNQIFKVINDPKNKKRPRILGLSASLVSSKCNTNEKFLKELRELETNMKCKAVTTDENLASYLKEVNTPTEKCIFYDNFMMDGDLAETFLQLEREALKIASPKKDNKKSKAQKSIHVLKGLIQNIGLHAIDILRMKENDDLLEDDLDDIVRPEDLNMSKKIKDDLGLYYDSKKKKANFQGYSEKVIWLFEVISDYLEMLRSNGSNKLPTVIVFTKERATAKSLEIYLKENFEDLRIGFMVGNSYRALPATMQSTSQTKQQETMNDFKLGKIAIIVATSVLEEGVDVQTCDLVIRFDKIDTFQSYVQSKGRARAKESSFVMLVSSVEMHEWNENLKKFRELESRGIELVHGSEPALKDERDNFHQDTIKPYLSEPALGDASPRLTRQQTVSIVQRYVDSLPSDRFTTLAPEYEFIEKPGNSLSNQPKLVKCILTLPHGSVHRDPIHGSYQQSKKLAKEDVAMEMCKILHQKGILDNWFNLIKPEKFLGIDLKEDDDGKNPKRGTKRSREYYPTELPPELQGFNVESIEGGMALKSGGQFYVYRLSLSLKETSEFALNVKEYQPYNPESTPSKLAIIVAQPLPWVAMNDMTLYTMSGTVQAKFELVRCLKVLPTEVYKLSMLFQAKIVPFILNCTLPWTVPDEDSSNYLISIVGQDRNFDLELLKACFGEPRTLKDVNNTDDFKKFVVQPIHIQTDMNYFVEDVSLFETTESLMPGRNTSYNQYFKEKYNYIINPPNQPLLSISNAGKEHFMFRNERQGVSSTHRRTKASPKFPVGAVKVQPIPASLWREVQMLPFAMRLVRSRIFVGKMRLEILKNTRFIEEDCLSEENLFNKLLQKESKKIILPDMDDFSVPLTMLGAGMDFSLERLEVMGDSFLKLIVSVGLYCNKSIESHYFNEGLLTLTRSSIVGNKKLYGLMKEKGFVNLIMAEKYEPHSLWLSPRLKQCDNIEKKLCDLDNDFRLKYDDSGDEGRKKLPNATIFSYVTKAEIDDFRRGRLSSDELLKIARNRHSNNETVDKFGPREHTLISDKGIADSAEALIGLLLTRNGHQGALEFMHWLGIDLSPKLSCIEIIQGKCFHPANFDWYFKTHQFQEPQATSEERLRMVNLHLDRANATEVENRLGYTFKNRFLMLQALTHGSYSSNTITSSYESLEFLGDAVIDYLVSAFLYTEEESLSPGQLTDKRSLVVCNNTLAFVCVKNLLYKSLLHHCPVLFGQIVSYVNIVEGFQQTSNEYGMLNMNMKVKNETDTDESVCNGFEIPKVLGDIVESLIGAIYLDSEGCLLTAWKAFKSLLQDDIRQIIKTTNVSLVKSVLELYPNRVVFEKRPSSKGILYCAVVSPGQEGGKPKEFFGRGKNSKLAKTAAARSVLSAPPRFP